MKRALRAKPTPACFGASSSTIISSATGSTAIPRQPPPPASRATGRNARLAPPFQPRRHFHARQVGIPVVRRLGPRVPHDPLCPDRSGFRQAPARAAPARVVHAPERPIARLRVQLRRCQSARPRLGLLARLQDDRPPAASATASSCPAASRNCCINFTWWVNRKDLEGRNLFCRRFPRPGQHRRLRPLPAAADRRAPPAGRRHRVDGLLLRDDARPSRSNSPATIRPTKTWPPSSSSISSPSPTP